MAILSIFHQTKGPLPITAKFQSPTDGPSYLALAGSVWTQQANQLIGIQVLLDGKPVGSAAVFSNLQSTHREVVPSYIPVKLTFGEHKIELTTLTPATVSDYNDFFELALIY